MLKTIKVDEYTVTQAGMVHALRRAGMFKKLHETSSQYEGDELSAVAVYPLLAGCIDPVISIEEFMQIPEQVLDRLTIAAMELNPHWFEMPEEEEKKTETEPPKSTKDSTT